jgi:hypothetical protein
LHGAHADADAARPGLGHAIARAVGDSGPVSRSFARSDSLGPPDGYPVSDAVSDADTRAE